MLHTLRQPGDGRYDETKQSQTYAILFEGERATNVQTAMSAINHQPAVAWIRLAAKVGSPVGKRQASIARRPGATRVGPLVRAVAGVQCADAIESLSVEKACLGRALSARAR